MTTDLTPRVVTALDDTELLPGGGARATTRVRFMVGKFGPFEHIFDRNPRREEIEQVMRDKRESLEGLV